MCAYVGHELWEWTELKYKTPEVVDKPIRIE